MWNKQGVFDSVREFFWSSLLLALALTLAVLSTVARRSGLLHFAVVLSLAALALAAIVSFTLVPRLLRRVKADLWAPLRFFRLTKRGAFFLFLVLLIGVSTFNTGNNLLVLVLSFLLAALLVSGMVSNLVLYSLKVTLNLPGSIHAGQRAVLLLTLHNLKRVFPSFALTLRGSRKADGPTAFTDFFDQQKHFAYVRPKDSVTVRMECGFLKRGTYPLQGFEVTTKFPFGFFVRGREIAAEGEISVYPAIVQVGHLMHRFPFLQGSEIRNRKGKGSGLYNIRDYQRGDDARFVHWKSTAKLSRLMVKEFVQEEDEFLHLVLSTHIERRSDRVLEQFETVLSWVTTLACLYRDRGCRFKFDTGEFQIFLDGRQERFDTLMEYLARVQPSDRRLIDPSSCEDGALVFTVGEAPTVRSAGSIEYLAL